MNNSYHGFHRHPYVIVTSLLGGKYYRVSGPWKKAGDPRRLGRKQGRILTSVESNLAPKAKRLASLFMSHPRAQSMFSPDEQI